MNKGLRIKDVKIFSNFIYYFVYYCFLVYWLGKNVYFGSFFGSTLTIKINLLKPVSSYSKLSFFNSLVFSSLLCPFFGELGNK